MVLHLKWPSVLQTEQGSNEVKSGPPVLSPSQEFLGDKFLGDAVWRRLRPDGMLMINALGPEDYLREIEDILCRCACCSTLQGKRRVAAPNRGSKRTTCIGLKAGVTRFPYKLFRVVHTRMITIR